MKVLASSLLVGVAAAAVSQQQHVLQQPKQVSEALSRPFHRLQSPLETLSSEVRAVWDEVAGLFPEAMAKGSVFSLPKKHTRRPESTWDHVIKGADIQSVWVENADGEQEREIDGKLENYNLRAKKVDPSGLGVDPGVKQYSGYLDDEEHDKHLFYCRSNRITKMLLDDTNVCF